jgi:hypothetical protein
LALHILNDIDSSDCAVVFKEIWALAERNSAVKKAVDEYYKKLHTMLFEALKQAAPDNFQDQKLNNAVAILLPYTEGIALRLLILIFQQKNYQNN